MAVTLDADPTSATFNCYCTRAFADDYHSMRLHNTAWTVASNANKDSALMWATRLLDTLKWRGVRYSGTQNLAFPRKGLDYTETTAENNISTEDYDLGLGYLTVIDVPDTTVPTEVKNATAELALWLVDSDTTSPSGMEGFKRIRIDTIELEADVRTSPTWFTKPIKDLVRVFLKNQSRYQAPTERV